MIKQAVVKRIGNGVVDVQPVGSANTVKNVRVSGQVSWDLLEVGVPVVLDELDQLPFVAYTIATKPLYYTPQPRTYAGVVNNALLSDGSVPLVGNLPVAPGVTVDGYDISTLGQAIINLQAADTIARTGYTVLSHATHLVATIGADDTTIMVRDALFIDTEEIALSNTEGHVEYMIIDGDPVGTVDDDGAPAWNYTVFRRSYTDPPNIEIGWAAGTLINGLTTKGYIHMDGRGNSDKAPSINVTVIPNPVQHTKNQVAAIGNLSGLLDFADDSYGVAFGRLTTGDIYFSFNNQSAEMRLANADIAGWSGTGSEAQQYYRIYGLFEDDHMPGDVRFGADGGRLELWNEQHKLALLSGDQEIMVVTPDGARFMAMVWAGDNPGPQAGIGKDGDDAVIALRNEIGGPGFVATAKPTGVYIYAGNPPPLPQHWSYDQVTNVFDFDGDFYVRNMTVLGEIEFSSIGSLKVLNPADPNRYGMMVPHGQYGYTVDAGGQQHISSVIAWAPLTLNTEPGLSGYTHTFLAGEAMFGRRRYRHLRVEPGIDGRIGLFDGDDPKAYLDYLGNAVIDGTLYAWNREVVVGREGHGIEIPIIAGDIDEVAKLVTFVDNANDYRFMAGFWSSTDATLSEASLSMNSVNRISITMGTYSESWSDDYRSYVRVLSNAGTDKEAWLRLMAAGDNGAANRATIDLYSLKGDDGSYSRIDLDANIVRLTQATAAPVATTGQPLNNGSISFPDGSGWHPSTWISGQYLVARLNAGWRPFAQAWGTVQRFGAETTNYAEIDGGGSMTFTGSSFVIPKYQTETQNSGSDFTISKTITWVNCNGGNRIATLPTAASFTRQRITVKKIDNTAYTVTIDGDGAETVDDAANYVLTVYNQSVDLVSNGTAWKVVSEYVP